MGGKDGLQVSSARGSRANDAQARDTGRLRRHLVALAIDQAMASQWPQAIETNLSLIDASGRDVEAYNRLGKAYAQLGRVSAACEAYTATLQIDPTNAIARRHVTRLAALIDGAGALEDSGAPHADPSFVSAEPAKTVVRSIVSDARGDAGRGCPHEGQLEP
jgi:tetratricopeptide (TPR) repeat protein